MSKRISTELLCRRYASALLDLSEKEKNSARVAEELGEIARLAGTSAPLRAVITNTSFNRPSVARAMKAILTQAGASPLVVRFGVTLAENGRLGQLPGITAAFTALLAERKGEVTAEIATAKPLTVAQAAIVAGDLSGALQKKVTVAAKLNKKLLGGMTVKIGSRLLDASVAGKLDRLELALKMVDGR